MTLSPRRRKDKRVQKGRVVSRRRGKKPSKKLLEKKADQAFSKYIRARDGACIACGREEHLQCAHIISRRYRSIRWDEANAVALCRNCHVYFTVRPVEWLNFVDVLIGVEAHKALRELALEVSKNVDYEAIAKKWQDELKALESEAHS